jgi:hypothetical protein
MAIFRLDDGPADSGLFCKAASMRRWYSKALPSYTKPSAMSKNADFNNPLPILRHEDFPNTLKAKREALLQKRFSF